jgi:glucose/arabinose dehydrogenase
MHRGKLFALSAAFAMSLASAPVRAAPSASLVFLDNFERPVYVTVAPGQPNLLFVVEQAGRIRVLQNEVKLDTPFLSITDLVRGPPLEGGNEQGMFSVAFHPDYQENGRFYVVFSNNAGSIELNEFRRTAASPLRAARSTRRILATIPHPGAENHYGGQLQFGPDGFLYWTTGDGGAVDPRGENARRLSSLLGKVLRIDPLPSNGNPYGIPPDNPYIGAFGRDEIFAYGLRNPWRLSFDGGRIIIADVGQQSREEINFLRIDDARGANFGWPQYEGDVLFAPNRPGPDPAVPPMLTYPHGMGSRAVIGGYVIRNSNLTALNGRYIYIDRLVGDLRSFRPDVADQQALDDRLEDVAIEQVTSFGKGFNGTYYVVQGTGPVSRLAPP